MPWELFPPFFWAVFGPALLGIGIFVLWDFRASILWGNRIILRETWMTLKRWKRKLWRKQVVVPFLVLLSVVIWRAWPLAFILTGANMKFSNDFALLDGHMPPEAPSVEIYQGLSHPFFEEDELIHEILFGSRKIIHGHGFASRRMEPNEVTLAVEKELWTGKAFSSWQTMKMCGGFHADYCFCWDREGVGYELMICLGCGEALLFRDGEALRCDLQSDFRDRLHDLASSEE